VKVYIEQAGARCLFANSGALCSATHADSHATKETRQHIFGFSGEPADDPYIHEGEGMRHHSVLSGRVLGTILFGCLLVLGAAAVGASAAQRGAQQNGVDNTKMGAYRALAQHIYGDFQKGDLAGAAEMARVLERVWDKAEEYGGDTALSKTNRKLFDEIDKAMDQFISPLTEAKGKAPDAAKVKAAFNAFLDKLKEAD
jgi:hypothetical protein